MKSAYRVLGIPGNATSEEIRAAFEEARARYPKERILNDQDAFERFNELREAYKVLSDSGLRELHDRKLNSSAPSPGRRPAVVVVEEETSSAGKLLKMVAVVVVALLALGVFYSHQRSQQRRLKFEEEEAKAEALAKADERERQWARAAADAKDTRLRYESEAIGRRVMAEQSSAVAAQQRQQEREKSMADQAERQRRQEAQQRVASDQQQLRNICMMNYGRPNC
jgi:curved DNA-binding protein CbpA